MADIFNSVARKGIYTRDWSVEYVTPIPKSKVVETEDQLRPISIVPDLCRDFSDILVKWLLPYVEKRMDPAQFGGMKGCSSTHYLILLYNFIMSRLDSREPKSVIISQIDFRRGFTKLDHNKILIRLSDWGVPPFLLKLIVSFLTDRSLRVRYRGAVSESELLPSGGPQGLTLTMILFLVLMSDSAQDPAPPLPLDAVPGDVNCVPAPPLPLETHDEIRLKFQDDFESGRSN